ncbi:unnamed protein product [Protopolystoma xenopodis]|uniref:Uncharacterized protein n=1 Tax=Protopolystoma xenopodis TaxID=117903 RepID=A0A3S5ASQ2_9PLAT|nr:unnamed protein product [Protopolystoma xenopodis]
MTAGSTFRAANHKLFSSGPCSFWQPVFLHFIHDLVPHQVVKNTAEQFRQKRQLRQCQVLVPETSEQAGRCKKSKQCHATKRDHDHLKGYSLQVLVSKGTSCPNVWAEAFERSKR